MKLPYKLVRSNTHLIDKRQISNIAYIARMLDKVKDVQGDIVECGVGKCRTLLYLTALNQRKDRLVYGYDSFKGFPEPTEEDISVRKPKKGEWSGFSRKDAREVLQNAGVMAPVLLVEGFFEDTVKNYPNFPIALLHLDVDLYQSYKTCLEHLAPHVVKGGIVMFDEYNSIKWPGATKAIDEYFKGRTPEYDMESGKYYMVM